MKVEAFDYDLPEDLIAQHPLASRASSRLLAVNRTTGKRTDDVFHNIHQYFTPGDTLVLNDTRVIPARLIGEKKCTGAKMEVLLLAPKDGLHEVLIKPAKRVNVGTEIVFGNGLLTAIVKQKREAGIHDVELRYEGILETVLDTLGEMPLPPYIRHSVDDKERYQTVYNKHAGSAAAPTAGLHFTTELLEEIASMGVNIVYITLHVGLGTFRPVAVDDVQDHKMHAEYYSMSHDTAKVLNNTKKRGNRIISVGTTSTRTLETIMKEYGRFKEASGFTDIFIYPGFKFKAVDILITNFHLPKSTLIMLVSAFSSKDITLDSYTHAVNARYRFFSFGDAMILYDEEGFDGNNV